MEIQDHKLPKQSGNEGQVQVCQKCGWPYPNPHPSAKHRRSHKKVCGKIEGYKLGDGVGDKTQVMDGSDGEHVSDDEGKTPSGKVVENTISRKSSSGVGSRSSRSNRSEEELFADAPTDFTDNSGSSDVPTQGVIQRFYSIQNDFEETNYNAQNVSADNTSAPQLLVKDHQDEVQTIPKSTIENDKMEANLVDQTMEEYSKTPHEQDIVTKPYEEIVLSEEKPELSNSYDNPTLEALEKASSLRNGVEEIQGSMESANIENNIENLHVIDQSFEVIDANNESTGKLSDVMEDHRAESRDDLTLRTNHEVIIVEENRGVSESKIIGFEENDLQSVDDMEGKLEHDVGQNSIVDLNTVGLQSQISPNADVSNHESEVGTDFITESFENEKVEEQKPVASLELGNIHENKNTSNDEEIGNVHTHLEGNEKSEIEDATPVCGSGIDGSQDVIEKPDPETTGINFAENSQGVTEDVIKKPDPETTGISFAENSQGVMEKGDSDLISNMVQGEALEVCDDARYSLQNSGVNDFCGKKFGEENFGGVESDRNNTIDQHLAISTVDVPDSSSQADSLEGNWGSVSVMSALSDTPLLAETLTSIQPIALPTEQNIILEPKSVKENQQPESQTSVDPNLGFSKTEPISEIQTLEEQQKGGTSSPNNLSLGGKSSEKNHTALKTLLGEATARSRAESPLHYNQLPSSTSIPLKDEVSVTNNGFSTTEKVIHSSNDVEMDASNEVGKEWDSPAKYPVNIKTEKKRGKNKTWMPFFCCSSVNAR